MAQMSALGEFHIKNLEYNTYDHDHKIKTGPKRCGESDDVLSKGMETLNKQTNKQALCVFFWRVK